LRTFFLFVGRVPKIWTQSIITLICNGGNAWCVENYRPIALTCLGCKLMERVIISNMLNYLRAHCT